MKKIRMNLRIILRGIGFRTADEIAARIGIHTDSDYRIKSGLFYTLQQAVGEGHIYLPQEELYVVQERFLEVEIDDIEKHDGSGTLRKSGYERMCQ